MTEAKWTHFKDDCCVLVSRYVILVNAAIGMQLYLLLNTYLVALKVQIAAQAQVVVYYPEGYTITSAKL